MKRLLTFAIPAAAIAGLFLPACGFGQGKTSTFVSPDIVTAGDISYPVDTTATGLVTLLLSLSSSAQVQNVQVLRDIPPLTSAAQAAVANWAFKPATYNGHTVASAIPVNVVFSPFNPGDTETNPLSVAPVPPASPTGAAQYTPPQITSAAYATYPPNTLAQGTVVLDVTIGKSGQVVTVIAVRGVGALTQSAISAVKSWAYNPATVKGKPVTGKLVVAFVFQRNLN